jgi:hypothetical protein
MHVVHKNMVLQKLPFRVTALKGLKAVSSLMHLQEVLKVSSVRFNTCLDMLYQLLSNTLKDSGGVAGSVTLFTVRC